MLVISCLFVPVAVWQRPHKPLSGKGAPRAAWVTERVRVLDRYLDLGAWDRASGAIPRAFRAPWALQEYRVSRIEKDPFSGGEYPFLSGAEAHGPAVVQERVDWLSLIVIQASIIALGGYCWVLLRRSGRARLGRRIPLSALRQ